MAIWTGLGSWSEFLLPLILLNGRDETLTVWLAQQIGQYVTNPGFLMASGVVLTIPPVIAFVFLQRYFSEGFTVAALR